MIPCEECIVYATCKLKELIVCDKAMQYCRNGKEVSVEKIYEVVEFLGKGVAYELAHDVIAFADCFTDDGVKLN